MTLLGNWFFLKPLSGSDEWDEGNWVHEDHSPLEYNKWSSPPSEDKSKNCARLNQGREWVPEDCYDKRGLICEYKAIVSGMLCADICYYDQGRVIFAHQYEVVGGKAPAVCMANLGYIVGKDDKDWQPLRKAVSDKASTGDLSFVIEPTATADWKGTRTICYIVDKNGRTEESCEDKHRGLACKYKRIDDIVDLHGELASGYNVPERTIEILGTCFMFHLEKNIVDVPLVMCGAQESSLMGKYMGPGVLSLYTRRSLFLNVGYNDTLSQVDKFFIDYMEMNGNKFCSSADRDNDYSLGMPDCENQLASICKTQCCKDMPPDPPSNTVVNFDNHWYNYTCRDEGWSFDGKGRTSILVYCKDGEWKNAKDLQECQEPKDNEV